MHFITPKLAAKSLALLAAFALTGLVTACAHGYAQVDLVDANGYHHHGYHDDHGDWHGGYDDENHQHHDDPHDWHN